MEPVNTVEIKMGPSQRRRALGTASALALMASVSPLLVSQAWAQAAAEQPESIVVSASRITTAGFDAPTPTTVIDAKELEQKAEPSIINTLAEMPSINASLTQKAVASGTTISSATLDPRHLGANRALVLLDGQRFIGATLDGVVDINQIPQQLVKRVDVVTGGASASWGSNAVSGVVNFVLDNQFSGFKANMNGGITTYGDDPTGQVQVAAGSDLFGGRGHIVVAGDFTYDGGVRNVGNRPWYTAEKVIPRSIAATPAGQPQYIRSSGVYEDQVNSGGIITAGPLKGTYFGPNASVSQFTYGSLVADPFMLGGTQVDLGRNLDLASEYKRGNLYGRFSYNLNDNTQVWVTGMWNQVRGRVDVLNNLTFTGSLTVQCDNAYLPAQVSAACATNKITNFAFGTSSGDIPASFAINSRTMNRVAAGADGEMQILGSKWTWDAWAEHAVNSVTTRTTGTTLTPLYNVAIDAVRNTNGQVVCRSALAQSNGCIPLDIIGTGVADPLAIKWVTGSGQQPLRRVSQRQEAASFSMNGEPLSDWAGPVDVATGAEYREEAYTVPLFDALSVGNGGNPLLSAAGNNWFQNNGQPGSGNYHVVEAFIEAGVPLFDSKQFGTANLDISGREEKFSTAGWFSTWKVGATWQTPFEGLRMRSLMSRDTRAPGLDELFAPVATGKNTVVDDFAPNAGKTFTVANQTGGNRALKPEHSTNTQIGFVYQPDWFPGFNASVDYWRINIKQAVTTLTPQQTIDTCFNGNTSVCANIFRGANGVITQINTQNFNLASVKEDGFDYEVSYHTALDDMLPEVLHSGAQLGLRALAGEVSSYVTDSGIFGLLATYTVGQLQQSQSDTTTNHWRILGTETLDFDHWGLSLTERWTSSGVLGRNYIQCTSGCPVSTVANPTINNNFVPSTFYLDVGGHYSLTDATEVYFKVDNVADAPPTLAPPFNGRTNINQDGATGELLGRRFLAGVRVRI